MTLVLRRKLFLPLQPELMETPDALAPQEPSPKGTVPVVHPKGMEVWLKTWVEEHCWTGLHWYWLTRACCQKLALAFCSCIRKPHSRLVAPLWKLLPRL